MKVQLTGKIDDFPGLFAALYERKILVRENCTSLEVLNPADFARAVDTFREFHALKEADNAPPLPSN